MTFYPQFGAWRSIKKSTPVHEIRTYNTQSLYLYIYQQFPEDISSGF